MKLGINRTGSVRKRTIEAFSCNHCYSGKALSITYSMCAFVALGTQHEMFMRRIVICGAVSSSVACPVLQYLSTLSYERHDLLKNVLNIKCVL